MTIILTIHDRLPFNDKKTFLFMICKIG